MRPQGILKSGWERIPPVVPEEVWLGVCLWGVSNTHHPGDPCSTNAHSEDRLLYLGRLSDVHSKT